MSPEEQIAGYREADRDIADLIKAARENLPVRCSWKHRKLAPYREGYFDGLVAAHCMLVKGEFKQPAVAKADCGGR